MQGMQRKTWAWMLASHLLASMLLVFSGLAHAQRGVEHALAHPDPVELQLIQDADCGCSRVLETVEVTQKSYGWLRNSDDVAGWRSWWQETGRVLAGHAAAGEEVVHGCMKDWRTRRFETTARPVPNVTEFAAELRERLHAARRALAKESQPRWDAPDWEQEMQRLTPRVHGLIEARPRPQAFWVFTAGMLVLLTAPLFLAMGRGTAGRVDTAVLVLLSKASQGLERVTGTSARSDMTKRLTPARCANVISTSSRAGSAGGPGSAVAFVDRRSSSWFARPPFRTYSMTCGQTALKGRCSPTVVPAGAAACHSTRAGPRDAVGAVNEHARTLLTAGTGA